VERPSRPELNDFERRALSREDLDAFVVNDYPRWGYSQTGCVIIQNLVGLTDFLANAVDDAASLRRLGEGAEISAATPVQLSKAFAAIGDLATLALYMMEAE